MAVYDKLKEKLKNYKPLDDIRCKGVISLDGIKYEIPGYICHYYDCEYSLYDEETGLLITEIYSYLSD